MTHYGNFFAERKKSSRVIIEREATSSLTRPNHFFLLIEYCYLKMVHSSNHAIVYGASGLIGWSIVDQLLYSYPRLGSFSKVTAITNRPLDVSESFWPEASPNRPVLQLVSGINLRHGDADTLGDALKGAVRDIGTVTHIYYLGILFP